MNPEKETKLLRIYTSSTDKLEGKPLYEALVKKAKKHGLAGATVLKGVMGYGASSIIHSSKLWEITEKLPMVVEIIDETEHIDAFLEYIKPKLDSMSKGCLVTEEKVHVAFYKAGKKES